MPLFDLALSIQAFPPPAVGHNSSLLASIRSFVSVGYFGLLSAARSSLAQCSPLTRRRSHHVTSLLRQALAAAAPLAPLPPHAALSLRLLRLAYLLLLLFQKPVLNLLGSVIGSRDDHTVDWTLDVAWLEAVTTEPREFGRWHGRKLCATEVEPAWLALWIRQLVQVDGEGSWNTWRFAQRIISSISTSVSSVMPQ